MKVVEPNHIVYVLTLKSGFPFVQDPIEENAFVTAFTTSEGAQECREYLLENEVIRNINQLQIMSFQIQGLWELKDELLAYAEAEYGSGFEIILQEPQEWTCIYDSTTATPN